MEGQAKYINLSHPHLAGNHKRKSKHNYIIHKNLTHNVMQFDHKMHSSKDMKATTHFV